MSFVTKIIPYSLITLDLGSARANLANGAITLRGASVGTWKANTITVLTLGGGSLSIRLDDVTNDLIPCSDGMKIEVGQFREIYFTNASQVGKTAKLLISFVDV